MAKVIISSSLFMNASSQELSAIADALMNDEDVEFFLPQELRNRFNSIMNRIDEWANQEEVWDCRAEVMSDVLYMLQNEHFADYTDEQIVEEGIASWLEHE